MYTPSFFSILINQAMHIFRCIAVIQGVTRPELHGFVNKAKEFCRQNSDRKPHRTVTAEEDIK